MCRGSFSKRVQGVGAETFQKFFKFSCTTCVTRGTQLLGAVLEDLLIDIELGLRDTNE